MRYVVEAFRHSVNQSKAVTVVERVFVNAGSRQYSTVECDILPAGFRSMGQGSNNGTGPE